MTGNVQVKGEGDGEPLIVNHIYDSAIVPPPILAADFNFLYLFEFLVNRVFLGGLPHEDPNLHIKNFLLVCALHRQKNVSDDAFRLRLFPFSLKGKARTWLDDLPARSIHNWDELLEAFLDELFPRGVIVELRCRVLTFKQKPHERLHEAWVRYKNCIRMCPQHRCTDESLLQRFYYTLNPENQILADNMAK
ncbi:hypothetical protein KY290_014090 [Solanum tuberosum]|uniref:Retrotransposon gag domain-containing protein n=1 Tax=Solanum tuberosum TaxID=4113 RepID=A0ABQ7VNN6_SOLTU|nr:hypothetical protein KY289_014187 [Solanum tuberosum]KAH0717485.1 hypothetical protein KY285_013516 [Solanum tuberosum]KAH0770109.1 hypothetical protein KY290_014090 [Solanum tuberosum]